MKNKGSNPAKRQYVTGHWVGWETWGGGERIWHENEFKIIEDLFPCKPVEKILFQVKQAQ